MEFFNELKKHHGADEEIKGTLATLFKQSLKNKDKPKYMVDRRKGPYYTIQDAIDAAESDSVIQLAPGYYTENIRITKPMIIEPRDKEKDVHLFQKDPGPVVRVFTAGDAEVRLNKLRIAFLSLEEVNKRKMDEEKKKRGLLEGDGEDGEEEEDEGEGGEGSESGGEEKKDTKVPESTLKTDREKEEGDEDDDNEQEDNDLPNYGFDIEEDTQVLLYVESGKVAVKKCYLGVNLMEEHQRATGVICTNHSELVVVSSEIKGLKNHPSYGLIVRESVLMMKDSKVLHHLLGGLIMRIHEPNDGVEGIYDAVKISGCKFGGNKFYGMLIDGRGSRPVIEDNKIFGTHGMGIRLGIATRARIRGNEIRDNQKGLEVESAGPFVFMNRIHRNLFSGIHFFTYKHILCNGVVKANEIFENGQHGIYVEGNTQLRIEDNSEVRNNRQCGIKVGQGSRVICIRNNIYDNLKQGILLVESASGHIQGNRIDGNIKANIALGGVSSGDTTIIGNEIFKSRCEGIFMIESGRAWVFQNEIHGNNDGIVLLGSVPHIKGNQVYQNERVGLMLCATDKLKKKSNALVEENEITANGVVGLMIKNGGKPKIVNNRILENPVNLAMDRMNRNIQYLERKNELEGEIQVTSNRCTIF